MKLRAVDSPACVCACVLVRTIHINFGVPVLTPFSENVHSAQTVLTSPLERDTSGQEPALADAPMSQCEYSLQFWPVDREHAVSTPLCETAERAGLRESGKLILGLLLELRHANHDL